MDGRCLSEDCRGHTLPGRQDLPCPVRLKLPPSQSASLVQLALPWSCYAQEMGVSVCAQLWNAEVFYKHVTNMTT